MNSTNQLLAQKKSIDELKELPTPKNSLLSATKKKIVEEKLKQRVAYIKEFNDIVKEISSKKGPAAVTQKKLAKEKFKQILANIKELNNIFIKLFKSKKDFDAAMKESDAAMKESNAAMKKSDAAMKKDLNAKSEYSFMQKLIVYIVIATVALLVAGIFALIIQQAKSKKDLFTDESVLRKWTNEN